MPTTRCPLKATPSRPPWLEVRQGGWDPEHDAGDRRNRDALAAGVLQAFQIVRTGVER